MAWYDGGETVDYDGGTGGPRMPTVIGGGAPPPQTGNPFGSGSFSDPDTAKLMEWLTGRLDQLSGPADPALSSIIGSLMGTWSNPYQSEIDDTFKRVLGEISGPAFSSQEDASRRAGAFAGIEQARDTGLRRATSSLASLGHGRGSGTIADALMQVHGSADQARAGAEVGLANEATQRAERNRQLATQIANLRSQMETAAAGVNTQRLGQAGSLQAALANLDRSRGAEALSLHMLPLQLNDQRLDRAMQLLGLTGGLSNPSSVLQSLMGLVNQTGQANAGRDARNGALWGGIGTALGQVPWDEMFT